MSDDLEKRMFCWPKEWIDAAIQSGLAARSEIGCVMCQLSGDALRDAVAKFASLVIEQSEADTADELSRLRAENEALRVAANAIVERWDEVLKRIALKEGADK